MRLAISFHGPSVRSKSSSVAELVRVQTGDPSEFLGIRLRWSFRAISLAVFLVSAVVAEAEESFPYTAIIAGDRTQLRSGPGDDHYATDELRRGTEVTVFRRVDGGWLGIQPPQTSYSWLSQRDIKFTEKADVAEVVGSAAVSWIGSDVDEVADHRWLVKLDRGETVTVLGKERRRMLADGKSDVYFKIAPPSGE